MSRKLQAIKTSDCGQYRIENIDDDALYETLPWSDYYVAISGYCGDVGPHVFAAAPELLEALTASSEYLDYHNIPVEIVAMVDFAIAKAKGETK